MSYADFLQLRLASAAAENPLRYEFITGRYKQYEFNLKSKRRIAPEVLIRRRTPLLSWSALDEMWLNIEFAGPVPILNPELGSCWLWKGRTHPNGHGILRTPKYDMLGQSMKHGAKKLPAYVVAFVLDRGRFPKPCCRHLCNTPLCLNPRHLRNGSVSDNARDRQKAGRTRGYTACMMASLAQVK